MKRLITLLFFLISPLTSAQTAVAVGSPNPISIEDTKHCEELNINWRAFLEDFEILGLPDGPINCAALPEKRDDKNITPDQMMMDLLFAFTALKGTQVNPFLASDYYEFVTQHLNKVKVRRESSTRCKENKLPVSYDVSTKSMLLCPKAFNKEFGSAQYIAGWIVWAARGMELGRRFRFRDCTKGYFKGERLCESHLIDRVDEPDNIPGGPNSYRFRFLVDHLDPGSRSPHLVMGTDTQIKIMRNINRSLNALFIKVEKSQNQTYSMKNQCRVHLNDGCDKYVFF